MAVQEVMKDLFFIERGYLNGNHFVYRSVDPILIDTGCVSDFHETEELIAGLGVNLSHTSKIINTHCHCDHIGGNKIIQDRSGCDIAMHTIGKFFIDTRDDWSTWWKYYSQEADFFDCTEALEDGETVALGPHRFEVIHTPGHASDGIVLFNRKEKALISSDSLWENDVAVVTTRVEGSTALFHKLKSLEKLKSLDVEIVFPGHGKPFGNIKKAIAKSEGIIENYMVNREAIGNDVLKKITVYTLLMKKGYDEESFFSYLMGTVWFRETIDHYFRREYELKYNEIMNDFLRRGIIERRNGSLFTTVKP
ncbi:MAG: MBL fold metallo-hydrolase [Desulfatiglans sp.]|jgi:glyoxylase-like metal-dependent hydrolase (beta-lactamase superfamily II)|nr:MBL fold metallo-hydrolase [Desulfatiglans sp.]